MIPFDLALFFRVLVRSFRPGSILRLFGFALLGLFNGLCLLLDEILFPGYRRVKIAAPVFILGNPRSGTTYLHRTLSRDEGRFFVFKTWEILFPSVLQKKLGSLLGAVDRAVGSPVYRIITGVERRVLGKFHDLHPTGLFHAEEDEMLFLHAFASLYLVFLFPLPAAFLPFADFDHNVPEPRRKRLMAFYASCLKRQAYARGRDKTFLSKNPFFSGKMASLQAAFPDARFIYLVRNPLEAIPSTISEGYATCVYAPRDSAPSQEFQSLVYDVAKVFYRRPLAYAAAHPECPCPILRFPDVTAKPMDTITGLYQQFGIPMTDGFRGLLAQEQAKAADYRSSHEYALGQFVIPARRIMEDLADVFDRFGFPRDVPVRGAVSAHQKPVLLSPAENIIHKAWDEFDGDGTGALRWRFRGVVDVARLRASLERVQQIHPKLKAGITVGANGGRYFNVAQTPNPIPVVVLDSDADPLPWQAEIYRGMSHKFDIEAGPLARVVVLRNRNRGLSEVILIGHHSIMDAVSAFVIMDDLFGFYDELEKGGAPRAIEPMPLVTAPRAASVGTFKQRMSLLPGIARHRRGRKRGDWTSLPAAMGVSPESCLDRHVFTEQETAAFLKQCRTEGAWPLGAHFAAACCALADQLTDAHLRIRCRVPMSIRPWLAGPAGPVTERDVGCFISAYESTYELVRPAAFWDLARKVRADMAAFTAAGGPQLFYNILRLARNARVRQAVKRETMVVNYLGVARVRKQYGGLALEEASTMAKNTTLGPSLGVFGVVINGRLCVSACGAGVPADWFRRFFESVVRNLRVG